MLSVIFRITMNITNSDPRAPPGWRKGINPLDWGCQFTLWKAWLYTLVSNVLDGYHVFCMLHISIVDLCRPCWSIRSFCNYNIFLVLLKLCSPWKCMKYVLLEIDQQSISFCQNKLSPLYIFGKHPLQRFLVYKLLSCDTCFVYAIINYILFPLR